MRRRFIPPHIQAEARAFQIWQQGHPVGWDCTISDLAKATGLPYDSVRFICTRRGWPVIEETRGFEEGPQELTLLMANARGRHDSGTSPGKYR